MKGTFSNDFKKFFLIRFTEELIRHSGKSDLIKLQKIIELKEKEKPIFVKREFVPEEKIVFKKEIPEKEFEKKIPVKPLAKPIKKITRLREIRRPPLFLMQEPKLPEHLKYLRPMPTAGITIDLFKLNPLIKDPAVRIIEVNPDEKVMVSGAMGTKPTNIFLNKDDIDRVIKKFSEVSKIPIGEGVYRVIAGNLILSAIISEVVGSKFIIKKMTYPTGRQQTPSNVFPIRK